MAARSLAPPASFVAPGATWPAGPLQDAAPLYATHSREVALRLAAAITDRDVGVGDLALRAGVDRTSLFRLLTGQVIPDLVTLGRLGAALGVDLWPGRAGDQP